MGLDDAAAFGEVAGVAKNEFLNAPLPATQKNPDWENLNLPLPQRAADYFRQVAEDVSQAAADPDLKHYSGAILPKLQRDAQEAMEVQDFFAGHPRKSTKESLYQALYWTNSRIHMEDSLQTDQISDDSTPQSRAEAGQKRQLLLDVKQNLESRLPVEGNQTEYYIYAGKKLLEDVLPV